MPTEKINNPNTAINSLETLAKKHDQLAKEAAELEYGISELREKIKVNREKKFLFTDKARVQEIEQEFNEYNESIAWREAELKKIWKKINDIQAEQLKYEAEKI